MSDNNSGGNNSGGDNDSNSGSGSTTANGTTQGSEGTQQQNTVLNFMLSNKVEAGLWLTRIFTVVCSFLFIFPILGGNPYGFYQRALISNAATSALRLHQRLPHFQFSREFFAMLFLEDSCHYLMFSLIFMNGYPITMAVIPVFLFALLHACNYTKNVLNVIGPDSMQFFRKLIDKLQVQQVNILRFVACTEIFIMPAIIFMMFVGKCSFFLPIVYYRFLSLRYSSRRNPYCRTLFTEMRMTVEHFTAMPNCPGLIRNACLKAIGIISRLAPQLPQ
ncbi:transmembrane protein 33-like isoform X2 [Ostrea edulis]|uniref:transmembrane protein 33-like isoform X2 n=1 Tax=Ostrea edulis TaxID=37623 RepID=UPI0020941B9E|nr:transmembrane protein 33-like isoform X2 [Ostrea edulis]